MTTGSPALKYCLSLLHRDDYDRYLAVLFAPRSKREALAALYAFNLEIARIADVVKEPLAGEIRLRWWSDEIEAGAEHALAVQGRDEKGEENPLLGTLLRAIGQFNLPKKPFLAAIDARIAALYPQTFATCRDFEFYCGETSSIFFQLACQILDVSQSQQAADASGHAGVAQTLCRILNRFGYGREKMSNLPHDLLKALGLDKEALPPPEDVTARSHLAAALIAYTREHYGAFAQAAQKLSASLRPAFLPLAPLPATLKMLEKRGSALFHQPCALSHLRRQWLITRTTLTGHFG